VFRTACGAQSARSAGGSFALCGGRLKKLFEKSFLRIFKNFPLVFLFVLNENFRPDGAEINLHFARRANYHSAKPIITLAKQDYHSREARFVTLNP
jgi:hypothetical protein